MLPPITSLFAFTLSFHENAKIQACRASVDRNIARKVKVSSLYKIQYLMYYTAVQIIWTPGAGMCSSVHQATRNSVSNNPNPEISAHNPSPQYNIEHILRTINKVGSRTTRHRCEDSPMKSLKVPPIVHSLCKQRTPTRSSMLALNQSANDALNRPTKHYFVPLASLLRCTGSTAKRPGQRAHILGLGKAAIKGFRHHGKAFS